jgi:hypothetical protein
LRLTAEGGEVDGLDGSRQWHVVDYFSCGGIEGEEVVVLSVRLYQILDYSMGDQGKTYSGIEASSSGSMSCKEVLDDISDCFLSAYGWMKAANVLLPPLGGICDARNLRCDGMEMFDSGVHCGRGNNRVVDGCEI